MNMKTALRGFVAILLIVGVASCGGIGSKSENPNQPNMRDEEPRESTIFDLFENSANPNTTVEVNKYIWAASLEVLNFLPIQEIDPFTGIIVTGYGIPPGGRQSYRAAIYIHDPALDARSLNLALQTKGGRAVSVETQRAIEDAILTKARQLRQIDGKL